MSTPVCLVWFRNDLRLSDNPALSAAAAFGTVLPIYIHDAPCPALYQRGPASQVYLHHALEALNATLGGDLSLYRGGPQAILTDLIQRHGITAVFWNRDYAPWVRDADAQLEEYLATLGVETHVFNGSYLWSPDQVLKDDGSYYKVFSPYKRKALLVAPRRPLPVPGALTLRRDTGHDVMLTDLQLMPPHPWADRLLEAWTFGEAAAQSKLDAFIDTHLAGYKQGRDYPGLPHTSKLSPHLHFGEISPNQVWEAATVIGRALAPEADVDHFLSELVWREFSCYLLAHFPTLPHANFQPRFDDFPWGSNPAYLKAWTTGTTGYPIIDAGMRELWQTGYMHNRVRMIVASFLVKNLKLHWHYGRDWFWRCLVDADLANNSASWQWVAGCGADAAPYFRIFNPVTQSEKFDPEGAYIKTWVPELNALPAAYLASPWEAPAYILRAAGVTLGETYPYPIIDLKTSRDAALAAYSQLTGTTSTSLQTNQPSLPL